MKKYSAPMEITLKTTQHNQSRNLANRVALVLSGLALTLGFCVATAGHASATTCAQLKIDIAVHNGKQAQVNTYDPSAVAAYNNERDMLNAAKLTCTL